MTVHACPPEDAGLMPCCDRTPFDAPRTDRMTADPNLVTCTGPRRIIGEGWTPQLAAQVAAVTARLTASAEKPTDDAPAPEGTTWDPPDPKQAGGREVSAGEHRPVAVIEADLTVAKQAAGVLQAELAAARDAAAGVAVGQRVEAAADPDGQWRPATVVKVDHHGGRPWVDVLFDRKDGTPGKQRRWVGRWWRPLPEVQEVAAVRAGEG